MHFTKHNTTQTQTQHNCQLHLTVLLGHARYAMAASQQPDRQLASQPIGSLTNLLLVMESRSTIEFGLPLHNREPRLCQSLAPVRL